MFLQVTQLCQARQGRFCRRKFYRDRKELGRGEEGREGEKPTSFKDAGKKKKGGI